MQDTLVLKGLSPSEKDQAERKAKMAERAQAEEDRKTVHAIYESDKLDVDTPLYNLAPKKLRIRHREQSVAKQMMNNCLLQVGVFGASIQSIFKGVTDLAAIVGTSLSQKHLASAQAIELAVRDDHYYYDTIAVSSPTAEILDAEVEIVARLVKELEEQTNPALKVRLQMEFNDTIAYLEMRPHPKTGMYVHDYDHIWVVEGLNNPDKKFGLIDSARFYTPLDNVVNLRGVKINPRVAFGDDTAQEVALSHDEKIILATNAPLPPTPRVS